ncbi:MAG: ABC transporter permease [Clostridia bacterium]|nr:ABC transporter permease [Clostridia bacterium]
MKFTKTVKLAFESIMSNKLRSFLTMLGIIIGVGAVIILVSIMDGVTGQVTDAFENFGMNNITVSITSRGSTRYVEPEDMYKIIDENPELFTYCTPNITLNATVKSNISSENERSTVTGIDETYDKINQLTTEQGRFLQFIDVDKMLKVCVIGTYYEQTFFERGKALGETIKINGEPFTIVGVLEEKADSSENSSDQCIYIPYTIASKMSWNSSIGSYTVTMADANNLETAKSVLQKELTEILGSSDFYKIIATQEILDELNSIIGTMKAALVCIAGISLLVGGIGIMNIMLVTVTERTREIGIRKSLGAKKKNILTQFVVEAATVSGVGGILGIVFGAVVSIIAGKLLDITIIPSFFAVALAFSVSVAIGIIFGYLPAKNAANLNPIDALRFE